jgi:hypothetical protein
MIRTDARLTYSGLTVVVSNPSRFDVTGNRMPTANGGVFMNECLQPEFNPMMVDFREADDQSPLRNGTKCILLMGEYAMHKWIPDTEKNTLNELRGSPLTCRGIPAIASYFYQDAVDIVNHESRLNEQSKDYEFSSKKDEEENEVDVKRQGKTARSNYSFWLRQDVKKCKAIIKNGGCIPSLGYALPSYRIYPPAEEVISVLRQSRDTIVDFDMETDYERGNPFCRNMQCFSFSVDNGRTIYCVPILNNDYRWAYTKVPDIMLALFICCQNNVFVAHNGATFDFPVLAYKYRIAVRHPWDTMLTAHRLYPDVEKSLGHWVSLLLWERFHKDENPGCYYTHDDMMRTLRYCGKDVYTMSLVRQEQKKLAARIPGMAESIEAVQRAIRPYITMSLQGIQYDNEMRQSKVRENDRLMTHYLNFIDILIGKEGIREVQSVIKSKHPGAFPGANKQTVNYFHNILGYPVVQRNPPDQHGVRNPSLAAKAMYKLRLKHDNPVIDFAIAYRQTKLETTTPLGFLPWKDNDNKQPLPEPYASTAITPQTSSIQTNPVNGHESPSAVSATITEIEEE